MIGFATPMNAVISRRNPVRVPRRDVLVIASDTPVISLTVYQNDGDPAPLDVTAATFTISLYREPGNGPSWCGWNSYGFCWDYGASNQFLQPYIVATFTATPILPTSGRVDFLLQANIAQLVIGRFWYELTVSYGFDPTTGIGVQGGNVSQANYYQGNFTIQSGVMEFPPGAQIATVQNAGLLDGIGTLDPLTGQPYGTLGSLVLGQALGASAVVQSGPYGTLGNLLL